MHPQLKQMQRRTHGRPQPHMESAKGFTLIELMVVVAITGLIAAMVVPSLPSFFNQAMLREEREKVVEFLRDARNQARTRQQCTEVEIASGSNTMTRTVYESCPNLKTALRNHNAVVPASPVAGSTRTITLSPKVQISNFNTGPSLIFVPPSGGLTAAVSSTLNLTRLSDGKVVEFEVFPAIGTIRHELLP